MPPHETAPASTATAATTVRQVLAAAAAQLASNEQLRGSARSDAELLLLHSLRISRATLLAHPGREVSAREQAAFQALIDRRMRCEPVQYITGRQEFYGLLLEVTPAVLIPRPETEHLVEAVLHLLPADRPVRIADVGTGSGAIAIALAAHLPQARITALDLSTAALGVAAANAATHGVEGRIQLLHSDLLTALESESPATQGEAHSFDAIVSNPPYVPESDGPGLHPQVRDHEPATALFAGADGLEIYRRLIPQAWIALRSGGLLALEIGHGQRNALSDLLSGWIEVHFHQDLAGIPRVAVARKPEDGIKRG